MAAKDASFFVFSPSNPIRVACKTIVDHPHFQVFILCTILLNSVFLALENPLDNSQSTRNQVCSRRGLNRLLHGISAYPFVASGVGSA